MNKWQEVSDKVKNGDYFKDSMKWYYGQYTTNYLIRNWLFFIFIFTSIAFSYSFYGIIQIVNRTVLSSGVMMVPYDTSSKKLLIRPLDKEYNNNLKNILFFMIKTFAQEAESNNTNRENITFMTQKLLKFEKSMSESLFQKFYAEKFTLYSDESSQDIKRVAKVLNIDFVNENSSSLSNIQDYFLANRVPSLAIVTLKVAFFDWADKNYKTEIKKIIVRFENVKIRSENGEMRNINFKITSYQAI